MSTIYVKTSTTGADDFDADRWTTHGGTLSIFRGDQQVAEYAYLSWISVRLSEPEPVA